jgi:shikimate dehydrogenase
VLGDPIGHSLSPALHTAAYAGLGLDWTYTAVRVPSGTLPSFLDGLTPEWRGLSLTMPLKREVVPMLDTADHWVEVSGVSNTVILDEGSRHGYNTDIPGAVAAIRRHTEAPLPRAVVIGGGATATSMLFALVEVGCAEATLMVRDPARAQETLDALAAYPAAPTITVAPITDDTALTGADIVVSTVPVAGQHPRLVAAATAAPVVFDVVYDPWPTPLMSAVQDAGGGLVTGLDLLVEQAVLQVVLMTGRHDVPEAALRAAGLAAVGG